MLMLSANNRYKSNVVRPPTVKGNANEVKPVGNAQSLSLGTETRQLSQGPPVANF